MSSDRRVNVVTAEETIEALQRVMGGQGTTLTEAFRRLVTYGFTVWQAVKEDGADIILATPASTKQVIIL